MNEENIHVAASAKDSTNEEKSDPGFTPTPQFWVSKANIDLQPERSAIIGFRDIARVTDARTMIATMLPPCGAGNTLPLVCFDSNGDSLEEMSRLVANFDAIVFDFVARQKVQSTHLNWYIVEQLPVVPREAYARKFGAKSAADIVKADVLALTYTANDIMQFARDMGYAGPPFAWDEAERVRRRARLDALYFMLYFPSATPAEIARLRDTAAYIFSTFPIVEREDSEAHGRYLSRDLCLASINALAAGDPDAMIAL